MQLSTWGLTDEPSQSGFKCFARLLALPMLAPGSLTALICALFAGGGWKLHDTLSGASISVEVPSPAQSSCVCQVNCPEIPACIPYSAGPETQRTEEVYAPGILIVVGAFATGFVAGCCWRDSKGVVKHVAPLALEDSSAPSSDPFDIPHVPRKSLRRIS